MQKTKETKYILWFSDIQIKDTNLVGGKNASLGEMYSNLKSLGVNIPNGFAITAHAYKYFITENKLEEKIHNILENLNTSDIKSLQKKGRQVRNLILKGKFPKELREEIYKSYDKLGKEYFKNPDVAIRSSATAEDLPSASFAGQQESHLNIRGKKQLLLFVKKCMASLFTDRAISYRKDKNFDHFKVKLSVGVQKMIRSDLASSGISFTIDTETGFNKVIIINGTYGLGEYIVQGKVIPDEWVIFKEGLKNGYPSIISKKLGNKNKKLVYKNILGIKSQKITTKNKNKFCLTNDEVLKLARWCQIIEDYFSTKNKKYQPMDIEWAKDGKSGELFIVQARPETIYSTKENNIWSEYKLKEKGEILLKGIPVGSKISTGKIRIIKNAKQMSQFKKGEILVTEMTDPDWEPIMKIASGIITEKGSRTSHAAIVSRELGVACVVGVENATKKLKTGEKITIDCSSGTNGIIYKDELSFKLEKHDLKKIPKINTKIMVNIGSPDEAFKNHYLPVEGVGLAREEFIIAGKIKFHPNALINYKKIKDKYLKHKIDKATHLYKDKTDFYVDSLAEGVAKIGVAFWPYQVIVRFSDFKSNEYKNLPGGKIYEPKEENPMIGWRGASRYHDPEFKDAFMLELKALKKVREEFGLKNIVPMVPFCRTIKEAEKVIKIIEKEAGLKRAYEHLSKCSKPPEECDHFRIYMMCEIPSNIILAEEFLEIFDGYSIGSNDLTQLTLGLDRDSEKLAYIGDASDKAVMKSIKQVIQICKKKNKYIGICGQAPSDIKGYADFLIKEGISSISLNPDTVIKTIMDISKNN